jgi:hypothetical protein
METFLSLQISYANRILTTGLGPLFENVPPRSAMLLLQVHESAFGVVDGARSPARSAVG